MTLYKGRIINVSFIFIILWMIRTSIISKYGSTSYRISFLSLLLLGVAWFFGHSYDKMADQAKRDPLTKLYNRYYVQERVDKILAKAQRKKEKVAIILLDIDHFKDINDQFGHEMGDIVLIQFTQKVMAHLNKSDIFIRWGGDEFLIISPYRNTEMLQEKISLLQQLMVDFHENHHPISVSVGKSTFPEDSTSFEKLFSIADSKMYQFKTS